MRFLHSQIQFIIFSVAIIFFSFSFSVNALGGNIDNINQKNLALINQQQEAPVSLIPSPPNINVNGYILMDADSGIIIAEKNMNQRLQPASLTKLMTLYIIFQALKIGQIHLDDTAKVSLKAWQTGGSRMFLKENTAVPIDLLIQGIIVTSGNDSCVTMAQHIGGTERSFVQMMNKTANILGMKNSHYVDSTGLAHQNHYSTPYDTAILARAIIKNFPEYYHYFSQKWLTYNNIKQPNRNRLLWYDNSADGLKTGHTKEAGYCLVASVKHDNMRLISVIMGASSDKSRANDSEALLNYGFRFYQTYQLFGSDVSITKKHIWIGKKKYVKFGLIEPLYVTIPIGEYRRLKATIYFFTENLKAPILRGKSYGEINITLNKNFVKKVSLVSLQDDPYAGFFSRVLDRITLFFKEIFCDPS